MAEKEKYFYKSPEDAKIKFYRLADKSASDNTLKGIYCGAPVIQKPIPKQVIYRGTKTIVVWKDDTRTVVNCSGDDDFHEDMGFLAAVTKKVYGNRGEYMQYVKNATHQDDTKKGK